MEATRSFRAHPEWAPSGDWTQCEWYLTHILVDAGKAAQAVASIREAVAMSGPEISTPDSRVCLRNIHAWALLKLSDHAAAVQAEAVTLEALAMCDQDIPQRRVRQWLRYNTMAILGGALTGQGRFADAEPLVLAAYDGLATDSVDVPRRGRVGIDFKAHALERIVNLYDAWDAAQPGLGYDAKASHWRELLDAAAVPAWAR